MSIDDLIDRVKTQPKAVARQAILQFILGFIGPPRKNDYLGNKFKREMRKRVGEL